MKKVIVFILLSLAVVLTTGGYFFHKAHLFAYKKEFKSYIKAHKNNIPTTQLIIKSSQLFVNTTEITWIDDNKEVYSQGKLYDIVTITRQKDEIILTVLSDSNEQKLKETFAGLYNNDTLEKNNHKPMKLLKQFLALKYIEPLKIEFNDLEISPIEKIYLDFSFDLKNIFLPQETPPPNFS